MVGLSTHMIAVKATVAEGSDLSIDLPGIEMNRGPTSEGWRAWARETKIRIGCTLKSLGIDTGFSISFDHLPARGASLDLAIFAACLGAIGKLPSDWMAHANNAGTKVFIGELNLQGGVRPVRGVLPMLVGMAKSRADEDERQYVVPYDCAIEAAYADTGTSVFAIRHVSELFDLPAHTVAHRSEYRPIVPKYDASDLLAKLPARVVHAIESAVVERRSIHLVGALAFKAARLAHAMLPPMTRDEAIESACMHSIAGLLRNEEGAIGLRPFRAPHHTCSVQGLVGGGDPIRCGEVSLAHNGVLFLDSLPEFKRGAIEVLASFLREGRATVVRSKNRAEFAAKPMLVTGCSRCPCEFRSGMHSSFCTEERRKEWRSRHVATLGIETIVDVDFAEGDESCRESLETIRERIAMRWETRR